MGKKLQQRICLYKSGKKTWAMPELIVIDKKVVESGIQNACAETDSTYCGVS